MAQAQVKESCSKYGSVACVLLSKVRLGGC